MGRLDKALKLIMSLSQDKEKAEQEIRNADAELRQAIINGETTGDKVKDFLLAVYSARATNEIENQYRALVPRFKDKTGEPVMMAWRTRKLSRHSMIAEENPPTHYSHSFQLGILREDPRLDVKTGTILFPTQTAESPKHAEYDEDQWSENRKWGLKDGDLIIPAWQFTPNVTTLNPTALSGPALILGIRNHHRMGLEEFVTAHIGWNEVNNSLTGKGTEAICGFVDRPFMSQLSYAEGLKILGAPLPPQIKEAYENNMKEKRSSLLLKLAPYITKDLSEAITNQRQETPRKDKQLRSLLLEAVEIGMHTAEDKLSPSPGISLELGPYITSLCQKYDISLPNSKP